MARIQTRLLPYSPRPVAAHGDDHRPSPSQRVSASQQPRLVDVDIPHAAVVSSSREPTPLRSHRQHAGLEYHHWRRAGAGACREPVMDRTMTMWVSPSACAHHSPSFPFFPSSFCCSVWSRAAKASSLVFGGLSLAVLSLFRHGMPTTTTAAAEIRSPGLQPRTPARRVLGDALPLLSNSLVVLAHVPHQTYLDFNAIILVCDDRRPVPLDLCEIIMTGSSLPENVKRCRNVKIYFIDAVSLDSGIGKWVLVPLHALRAGCFRYSEVMAMRSSAYFIVISASVSVRD